MKRIVVVCLLLWLGHAAEAQVVKEEILRRTIDRGGGQPGSQPSTTPTSSRTGNGSRKDTLGFERRDDSKEFTTITYKYLDSLRSNNLDSSVNDFDRYFSVPSAWQHLGNNGNAAFRLVYQPVAKAGWDAGFHAYDLYRFHLAETKFYKTSRPFTQLNYQLASGKEQLIKVLHTQSPRPNLHFGFDYRLISAPGFFLSQNTNHNNYRLFGNYTGKRKRYAAYVILQGNKIKGAENGGIVNDTLLDDPNKKKRFSIPVNIGNSSSSQFNPFSTAIAAGNTYRDFTFFYRHSYDIGKRDSLIINDSTTEYLFYPKLRFQHTLTYSTYTYNFTDDKGDSVYYRKFYDTLFGSAIDTLRLQDKWKVISNDFSLLQFPDTKNPAQFFLAGLRVENITGTLRRGNVTLFNAVAHAEYRNKTRNKKWDILASGEFYAAGAYAGDYQAQATLGRTFNKKWGDVQLHFANVNRTPSFIFDNRSAFKLVSTAVFKKENIVSFGAVSHNALFTAGFNNYFITNLAYFHSLDSTAQYSKVINLLQVFATKKIRVSRRWNWYVEATLQQTDGNAPIKVPLLFTRHRLAYEGIFYKNLHLSTGLELRYYTPYKGYNYSPVMGQFVPQDTARIRNLPDIAAFLHFRIRTFTGFVRAENLNTMSFRDGFGFTNNNMATLHQPTQGLIIRFGIRWGFVN